ncbi:TonB-dependent receptor [Christiangramia forsetii]|uniref:TonB-dependent outer membrane receptor n=2 Tax=Christiangramia forsetii TaxID=411153 RepID=A0M1F5_CHRFK|nr:TonB-dependent receptor [Christiangramia forsetii]GGG42631.1 TonB-dependent receptor [Christiangramia forsetii]CAL66450.1 TonB-dependent outer membrane receptor [Christiangramia forsetii KT0803]
MNKILLFIALLMVPITMMTQEVKGIVTDNAGTPLPGVNVYEKGTEKGTSTDFDGRYTIEVAGEATLVFSFVGFEEQEVAVNGRSQVDVTLADGVSLGEVQLVGSRSPRRTATDTPVAVDVIDVSEVNTQTGKIEVNELLQYAAPSFNANKQSGSDGADHIDPASLRGLGPDQTLVLVNGKRRHQSSLINVFGTRGRGNTGTDLNAIPAASIKRIEILRDGASAQYGSDAIAGVINIVLKDAVEKFSGSVNYGFYSTNADGDFPDGTPNTDGNRLDTDRDGNAIGDDQNFDGGSVKVAANYGFEIADEGYANFTMEYLNKNKTLRPGFDFRRGFGEASIEGVNFMGNLAIPISENSEFYAFGGRNYRDTDAFAFTRNNPTARNVVDIYPNGFTPRITSIITDNSVAAGFRTKTESGWNIDISNTWGKNLFHYYIKGTLNASLGENSPTDFDAGGHNLSQNVINLDFSKYYEDMLEGVNFAFGAEYRTENFEIFAGEEGSYATYDEDGRPIINPDIQQQPIDPMTGDPRPGGSQGFPGYGPANEVDRSRSNVSLYADAEFEFTEAFLLAAAARFENYSDFGSTINGKLAARLKATDDINIRGSVSTGFRAPSLAQIYYNLKFTNFVGGDALESLLSPNNSPVTASFGIGALQEETALNASLGFTANFGKFTATVDGYYINVQDRIVLTGNFDAPQIDNVEAAQFFANGADTETVGLDIVLSNEFEIGEGKLTTSFIGNFNNMEITEVKNGNLNEQTFFGERDKSFLLASAPDSKLTLNLIYDIEWFDAALGLTRFSDVTLLDFQMLEPVEDYGSLANQVDAASDVYDSKIVTDLNLGFKLNDVLKLNVGSNNLFNVYPDQQDDWTEAGGYWDAVQMGFGGAYYYAKLNIRL